MCCITIETEVLVANFFGSPKYDSSTMDGVEIQMIEKCANVLANNLPGYVFYDLSQKRIEELVRENRDFFMDQGKLYHRGKKIEREKYNVVYTHTISERINELVDYFFERELYNKEIKRLVQVQA